MSTSGIHAAVSRVINLNHLKEEITGKQAALEVNPIDFPALIDLLIADLAAMREGKDVEGVYRCVAEEIHKGSNLDRCAQVLLNFYEKVSPAMDHIVVEDKICRYIKLKAMQMIERCIGEINRIAQGRPLATLEGEDLRQVLEWENRILKINYPNMSEAERLHILTYVQEVLRGNAASEIPESTELQALNRVIGSYQLSGAVKSLDDTLREVKDLVCTLEERGNLGDIPRYLATIQFLMTILSTHSIMVKREQIESVERLQHTVRAVRHIYESHGRLCSSDVEQRIQKIAHLKEVEILKSGKLLAVDPVNRILPKDDADVEGEDYTEGEDYEDYLMAYDAHMEIINESIATFESILRGELKAEKALKTTAVELSGYFLEEIYDDGDPLANNIREVVAKLLDTPSKDVNAEFLHSLIKLLVDQGQIMRKDHIKAVVEESIKPTDQGAAACAEAEGDEVNAGMRALLQQLSLI